MKDFTLTKEKKGEILEWFWDTSIIFTFQELEDFKQLLDVYPKEIGFAITCMIEEGMSARQFIDITKCDGGLEKLLEFTKSQMKRISKTKTIKIMHALEEKDLALNFNISDLTTYHGSYYYQLIKNVPREELLCNEFKRKKYPRR